MAEEQVRKNVTISGRLYRLIEDRVADSEFTSVDEYVDFILEEVLDEEEEENQLSSEDEDREVKKRLKDLGYLD